MKIVVKFPHFAQKKAIPTQMCVPQVANTLRVATCARKLQLFGRGRMEVQTIGQRILAHTGVSETGSGRSNAMMEGIMEVSKANGRCVNRFVAIQNGGEPSGTGAV